MPKLSEVPKKIKPYLFHGVTLELEEDADDIYGDCPLCGRVGKFSVNSETGQWRCFVCNTGKDNGKVSAGGNIYTLLEFIWKMSLDATKKSSIDYESFKKDRKFLYSQTLEDWGVAKSFLNGYWIIPAFNTSQKLSQLYRYSKDVNNNRMALFATPDLNHHMYGSQLFNKDKKITYICEGVFDAMCLWELLNKVKLDGDKYIPTSNPDVSLGSFSNVVAVPSCSVFPESWLSMFPRHNLILMYDSDHPKLNERTNTYSQPAGFAGMKSVAQALARAEEPPSEIMFLEWGIDGYDPNKPSGYDVRDFLSQGVDLAERAKLLGQLFDKLQPIPNEWIAGRSKQAERGGTDMECLPCNSWNVLVNSWRKPMKWTEGLDRALSVMLACVASTKIIGDQLWVKVISPASTGKSTLCEALSINKKHIEAKSTIRGFHSGFKSDNEGKQDHGLIAKLYDKTLITKDGDTLLQSPNLRQILSEARDIYDGTSRTHYRHGVGRDYQGIRTTWILCGTGSLRSIDSSELGERFLDCVIMERIDEDLEDEILLRVAHRTERNMSCESNGQVESQHDENLVKAMQLTGGYVDWLKENAGQLLGSVKMNDVAIHKCISLGKFVAFMRARPSRHQDEDAERELASRLTSQFVRLSKCLAVVLNRPDVDKEVLRRATRVATDTARGKTMEIARYLYKAGDKGVDVRTLAQYTNHTEENERKLLKFLRRIGAVDVFELKKTVGLSSKPRWRLTPRLRKVYEEVMG